MLIKNYMNINKIKNNFKKINTTIDNISDEIYNVSIR